MLPVGQPAEELSIVKVRSYSAEGAGGSVGGIFPPTGGVWGASSGKSLSLRVWVSGYLELISEPMILWVLMSAKDTINGAEFPHKNFPRDENSEIFWKF